MGASSMAAACVLGRFCEISSALSLDSEEGTVHRCCNQQPVLTMDGVEVRRRLLEQAHSAQHHSGPQNGGKKGESSSEATPRSARKRASCTFRQYGAGQDDPN